MCSTLHLEAGFRGVVCPGPSEPHSEVATASLLRVLACLESSHGSSEASSQLSLKGSTSAKLRKLGKTSRKLRETVVDLSPGSVDGGAVK